jgi:hypothetical protein
VTAVVQSLEQALYQVWVIRDGREFLLAEDDGSTFRRNSLAGVRKALQVLPLAALRLRQQSPYDEMIGQPVREQQNTLEVPLSLDPALPAIRH